jgi:mono/diheme cytochrome c family protein
MPARSVAWRALLLSAITLPALGQPVGDPVAGELVAAENCAQCHGPVDLPGGAPTFASIAEDPAATEDQLIEFLSTPHATMPSDTLTWKDRRDLVAFIMSLRR